MRLCCCLFKSSIVKTDFSADFFVLRTPMLPYAQAIDLYNNPGTLLTAYADDMVQEALFIASPVLYSALEKYRQGSLQPREMKKAETGLWQYLIRMSTRCTPFGIFSGCAVGGFAPETQLQLPPRKHIKRHMRLDMDYLCRMADFLSGLEGLKEQLVYYPNSSLYPYAQQLRFAQYTYADGKREYHLVKFDRSAVLHKVLQAARSGKTFSELAGLVARTGASTEEAADYIYALIEEQLLKSELEPNLSGKEYMEELITGLQQYQYTEQIVQVLQTVQSGMRNVNTEPGVDAYRQITRYLSALPITIQENRLFQVDTVKPVLYNQLTETATGDIWEALTVVARLSNEQLSRTKLEEFKRAFEERYSTQQVPLVEALDAENGIGFQQAFSTADHHKQDQQGSYYEQNPVSVFLLGKYREALRTGASGISLSADELAPFQLDTAALPDSMGAVVSLYKGREPDELLIRLIGASPAAAKLLARFCHADALLAEKVSRLVRQEEALHPNKIFAEVLHLPQAKVGNILTRTHLRKYEIPYLSRSTRPLSCQIPVTDLHLQLLDGHLVLTSKRLGKEVVPQLSSAHNFTEDSLPIYNFLCSLEFQGKRTGLSWNWGFLSQEPFLPRVSYRNIILKSATWNIKSDAFRSLHLRKIDDNYYALFTKIRSELSVPDQVLLVEGDNELLLDLRTEMGMRLLVDASRQQPLIILSEVLANEHNLLVSSEQGALANEVIIPFVRKAPVPPAPAPRHGKKAVPAVTPVPRQFPPGSEWTYYKIYTGEKTADEIIRDVVHPFARKMLRKNGIDQWFFIRYSDPHHHIRVRFHAQQEHTGNLITLFKEVIGPYLEKRLITNLQLDTYEREVERYGVSTIALFETAFCIHSRCISELLLLLHKQAEPLQRNMAGLLWIDLLLGGLGSGAAEKAVFYERCFESFTAEFRYHEDKKVRERLSEDYRRQSALISQCIRSCNDTAAAEEPLGSVLHILLRYMQKARPLFRNIRRLQQEHDENFDYALRSYLHMFINSLMPSDQRWEELNIYFFLSRYYTSETARQTKKSSAPALAAFDAAEK